MADKPKLSENAIHIFKTLYSREDESIEDTFKRVANVFGNTEEEKQIAYDLQAEGVWRPNTPVYFNAGKKPFIASACWVVGLHDSMESIYDVANVARKIFQEGSGIGIPIGNLREKDAPIFEGGETPIGKSSGAITFLKLFDAVGETTKSGGRIRRAAILASIPVWHPDILSFINCKREDGRLSNMNLSVCITDDFMDCLNNNIPFPIRTPYDGSRKRFEDPNVIWNELVKNAHASAEPGVIFIDTVNKWNPLKKIVLIETSNPCVVGDTLVSTPNGNRRVDEFNIGDEINTIDGTGFIKEIEVYKDQPVFEVVLSDGKKIDVTYKHQFMTICGWKELEYLKIGDFINTIDGFKKVESIKYIGIKDVYDLYEPITDTWITNGIISRGCGEQTIPPWYNCNLSMINISKFVNKENKTFNWDELFDVSKKIMFLMDNLIDKMDFPDERFRINTIKYRPIGIGIAGLADALYMLDLRYNAKSGRDFAEEVYRIITSACVEASTELAEKNGPFANYDIVKDDIEYIVEQHIKPSDGHDDKTNSIMDRVRKFGLRNFQFTTAQPTGTTALSCDASYGIEPCFGLAFKKNLISGETMNIVNPIFKERFENESWYNDELIEKILANKGSLKGIKGIPKEVKDVFVVAYDIKPADRVEMQAAIQKRISTAVSSTVNLPSDVTEDEVSNIFKLAYEKGLKGITIYRDGSRKGQPVTFKETKEGDIVVQSNIELPTRLQSERYSIDFGEKKLYIHVSKFEGMPVEVFLTSGSQDPELNGFLECIGKILSVALQHRVPREKLTKQMRGIVSRYPVWCRLEEGDKKPVQIQSMPDAVAAILDRFYGDIAVDEDKLMGAEYCPKCNNKTYLVIEGCYTCQSCGYSKCS